MRELVVGPGPEGGHANRGVDAPMPRPGVVLVVDDEPMVRQVACRLLGSRGWTCHEAADGDAALAYLAAGLDVDGVVLDMRMPGMDGAEVLARLREGWPGLPVLMVSGLVPGADVVGHVPGVAVLAKPYSFAQLLSAVERWRAMS